MTGRMIHFLIVEDDDGHAELIAMAMEDQPLCCTFDRVADGAEAMAYLRREGAWSDAPRPDVLLLDLRLPKLDGHEVLAAIKEDERLRTIPVVIMTTSASETDRARAYLTHANSYLVKPVDFDKFQEMVRDLKIYWANWNQKPAA